MAMTGVYPVYSNKFKVGLEGRESSDEKMVSIAEMESFSVAIDGSVEEWTPMDSEGWIKRLTTGKGLPSLWQENAVWGIWEMTM